MHVFLRIVFFIVFLNFFELNTQIVEEYSVNAGNNSEEVFETQHTICQINTLQLAATAKATVTRALKGVCLTRYVDENFRKIEKLLKDQLDFIKEIDSKIHSVALDKLCKAEHSSESLIANTPQWDAGNFKEKADNTLQKPSPREIEIKRFNGTVFQDSTGKSVFMYFWKLENIKEKLISMKSVRSQNFYITPGGYCMYLRLSPTQNADTIYIQAGLTHGSFDETLLWPFRLKHKLSLLDQDSVRSTDIQSRIWDPSLLCSNMHWHKPLSSNDNYECVGLAVSNHSLYSRTYVYFGSLIIKFTVYLE